MTYIVYHGTQCRDVGCRRVEEVGQVTTRRKQFGLTSKLPSDTDESSLGFGNLMRGADNEHLIKDLQQMIEVKPLEDDLLGGAKASTGFSVSILCCGREMTCLDQEGTNTACVAQIAGEYSSAKTSETRWRDLS